METSKIETKKPSWLKINKEQAEELVVKLAKEGKSPEKIGLILRDQHGIPTTRVYGIKLNKILKQKSIEVNPDLNNINKKTEKVKKHLEKHKHDTSAKKALIKREAMLKKARK